MNRRVTVALAVLMSIAVVVDAGKNKNIEKTDVGQLQLMSHLPKAPLLAWDSSIGNGGDVYDSILALLRRFVPEEELPQVEEGIAAMDEQLGFSLRDDLLVYLGPEMAGAIGG